MYEDGRKGLNLNWGSLLVKLVVLIVIVFIIGWIVIKVTNTGSNNKNTLASINSEYIDNITAMKTAAFEYFTKSKLPEKVGASEKVTLTQMINQKLLIDFTDDGKKCDTSDSYIQATKTADGNYALKVSLTCGEESDFIVTTIEDTTCVNEVCTVDNTKTNTDVVDTSKAVVNSTKSSTSKTNSSSSTTSKKTSSASTTSTVTTKVTIKVSCTNGCCQDNCSTSKEKETPKPKDPTKVRYYKYVKYGDWVSDKPSGEYETKSETVKTYNYCKKYTDTYYSTSYVMNSKTTSYSYEAQFVKLPSNAENVAIVNNSISYFSSSTTDYQSYINERGSLYMTNNNSSYNVSIKNASTFRNTSLKTANFDFTVSGAYYNSSKDYWATKIKIYNINLNGVTPYYASNLNANVYFVPVKFDVVYTKSNKCTRDLASNSDNYKNYVKTDLERETVTKYRTVEYKWSKESSLSGYTYTGEYEDRTA